MIKESGKSTNSPPMIDRVAKAIHASKLLQPAAGPWPACETATTAFCRDAARAALDACAAPDMLEALRKSVEYFQILHEGNPMVDDAIEIARAAIAKATERG